MLSRAELKQEANQPAAVLEWYERAYHKSKGLSAIFHWDYNYLAKPLEFSPEDKKRIETETIRVFIAGSSDWLYASSMSICGTFFCKPVKVRGPGKQALGILITMMLFAGKLVAATAPHMANAPQLLDPTRVAWSQVSFHASKLLLSADASMTVEQHNSDNFPEPLMLPGSGVVVELDDEALVLTVNTRTLGKKGLNILLMNSRTGAAVQFLQTKADRYRISRFTDIGRFMLTWKPGKKEKKLPHDQWTNYSENVRSYPPEAVGKIVAEPAALIYIIAAAPVLEPGDRFELLTIIKKQVFRVIVEVALPRTLKTRYLEHSPSGTKERRNNKEMALRLIVRGEGLNADDDQKFQLLGLEGDIELFLQPETRLPLQLNGKIKVLGKVKFRLREARLR